MILPDDPYHDALGLRQDDHQQDNQIAAKTAHRQGNREYPEPDSLRFMDPHSTTGFGDADRSSNRISATRRAEILRREAISRRK